MGKIIRVGAHRGAMCYAPENTLAAFETAIAQGAYRVEFDVRRSRDGHLVVIHDATLDRTTNGIGPVAAQTLNALKCLRVGETEVIPTLEETLLCARGRCKLLVEIKEQGLADDVIRQIVALGMEDDCTIASFHEDELLRTREVNPRIATAYFLTTPQSFDAQEIVARLGVSLLVVWPVAATPEYIAAAKACGLQIRCGFRDTFTYEETFALFCQMADSGVDEIACGRPDWIARMAHEYARRSQNR